MKIKLTPIQALSAHCIRSLPDSTNERRLVLAGITQILEPGDDIRDTAVEMIHALDRIERAQIDLFAEADGNGKAPR